MIYIWIGGVFGYLFAGSVAFVFLLKFFDDDRDTGVWAVLGATFWPALLPIVLGLHSGKRFHAWYTAPERVAEALRKAGK